METRRQCRLSCWQSIFPPGVIEGVCPICGSSTIRYSTTTGTTFQLSHIVARSNGGASLSYNLLPSCGCNQNVGRHNLIDWMACNGKKALMRPLFLRKYKSLVAPYHRSRDPRQLIHWIQRLYKPLQLSKYSDWLLLLESDIINICHDDDVVEKKMIYSTRARYPLKGEMTYAQRVACRLLVGELILAD
jgi:hypothetical protein